MAVIGAAVAAPLAPKNKVIKYQPILTQNQPIRLVDTVLYQDLIPSNTQLLFQEQTVPILDDVIIQDIPVVDLILS